MVRPMSPQALASLLHESPIQVYLLDVREPEERAVAAIEPSAHIPMDDVEARISEIPRDRPVVVYCHHGTRSFMIASFLENEGYENVASLTGGIDAWSERVDPKVPQY
jgi:rhodanese-related sulfurtransferase